MLLCELEIVNQIILLVTISFKEEVSLVRLATYFGYLLTKVLSTDNKSRETFQARADLEMCGR